ncbi:hypothetical protein Hanom_Chr09g00801541 [Helianthus anomalus]
MNMPGMDGRNCYADEHYLPTFFYKKTMVMPCMWNGINLPCYLFARKFKPDTLHRMIDLFTNQTMF